MSPASTRVRQVPHTPCAHDTGMSMPSAASASTTLIASGTRTTRPELRSSTSKRLGRRLERRQGAAEVLEVHLRVRPLQAARGGAHRIEETLRAAHVQVLAGPGSPIVAARSMRCAAGPSSW
jgi:hypothetical protein